MRAPKHKRFWLFHGPVRDFVRGATTLLPRRAHAPPRPLAYRFSKARERLPAPGSLPSRLLEPFNTEICHEANPDHRSLRAVRERVIVGEPIAQEVELQPVPYEWGPQVQQYRYVYADDHVAFVDPGTRRVIQVVE